MPPDAKKAKVPESEEWISIRHPKVTPADAETTDLPRVTREAFNISHSKLGWVEEKGLASTDPLPPEIPTSPTTGGS